MRFVPSAAASLPNSLSKSAFPPSKPNFLYTPSVNVAPIDSLRLFLTGANTSSSISRADSLTSSQDAQWLINSSTSKWWAQWSMRISRICATTALLFQTLESPITYKRYFARLAATLTMLALTQLTAPELSLSHPSIKMTSLASFPWKEWTVPTFLFMNSSKASFLTAFDFELPASYFFAYSCFKYSWKPETTDLNGVITYKFGIPAFSSAFFSNASNTILAAQAPCSSTK